MKVSESDDSYALVISAWMHRSDAHANCESRMDMLSKDVFGKFADSLALVALFWYDGIIELVIVVLLKVKFLAQMSMASVLSGKIVASRERSPYFA